MGRSLYRLFNVRSRLQLMIDYAFQCGDNQRLIDIVTAAFFQIGILISIALIKNHGRQLACETLISLHRENTRSAVAAKELVTQHIAVILLGLAAVIILTPALELGFVDRFDGIE